MSTKSDAIVIEDLHKAYGDLQVLRGVDLRVPAGDIFALLGSNGAGKTTAMRILATLLRPDTGTARVCGYDVVTQAEHVRMSISLTGQFAAVDEILTGRENLEMIGALLQLPDPRHRASELLEVFQLEDAATRRAITYSGGMRRRLDIAMSLMGSPAVIVLDEPTTGLDPQNRIAMWDLVRDLADDGTTILLTTQYLEEAERLADKVAILHEGVIATQGTPADLLRATSSHGVVELAFHSRDELDRAAAELGDGTRNEALATLSLRTDGSVNQLSGLLTRLDSAGISPASLTQKQPTLEETFLTLVGATAPIEGTST